MISDQPRPATIENSADGHEVASAVRGGARQAFVIALFLRLAYGLWVTPFSAADPGWKDFYWSSDGYTVLAETLVDHGIYAFGGDAPPSSYRAPLFPLLVAAAYWLTSNLGVAVLIVNAVASAATCTLLYRFVVRSFPAAQPQAVAAWSAVALPMAIFYIAKSFSDSLLALLVIGALLASVQLLERATWRSGVAAGVWFGLGALTKTILLPIVALLVLYALIVRRRALGAAVLCGVVTAAVISPWAIRNYGLTGGFSVAGGGGFNLLFGTHLALAEGDAEEISKRAFASLQASYAAYYGAPLTSAEVRPHRFWEIAPDIDRRCAALALHEFVAEPLRLPHKLVVNAGRFWYLSTSPTRNLIAVLLHVPLVLLALPELRRWARVDRGPRGWLFVFIGSYFVMYLVVNVATVRYALPLLLMLVPFAGAAVERAGRTAFGWARERRSIALAE